MVGDEDGDLGEVGVGYLEEELPVFGGEDADGVVGPAGKDMLTRVGQVDAEAGGVGEGDLEDGGEGARAPYDNVFPR